LARQFQKRSSGSWFWLHAAVRRRRAETRPGGARRRRLRLYVLVDRDGSILGRFNLYDLEDGAASVGYRVAEQIAGREVATEALRDLCRRAATDHGLRVLSAETSRANVASQRVLEKAGFTATGSYVVAGDPGLKFTLALAHEPT
jgi:[ribosomal protein S5]-alanine N-acetyltransferase